MESTTADGRSKCEWRFEAKGDPPQADLSSEKVILEWANGGHNGGCLRFGPDGCLYVATGDGSGVADSLQTGQNLGTLPGGWSSEGWAISADGSVIVGVSSGTGFSQQAIRWTSAGGMQHLGVLPGGFYSHANAMTPDGAVVVGGSQGDGINNYHAIVWTADSGMVDLNTYLTTRGADLTGWELENAIDISAEYPTTEPRRG